MQKIVITVHDDAVGLSHVYTKSSDGPAIYDGEFAKDGMPWGIFSIARSLELECMTTPELERREQMVRHQARDQIRTDLIEHLRVGDRSFLTELLHVLGLEPYRNVFSVQVDGPDGIYLEFEVDGEEIECTDEDEVHGWVLRNLQIEAKLEISIGHPVNEIDKGDLDASTLGINVTVERA